MQVNSVAVVVVVAADVRHCWRHREEAIRHKKVLEKKLLEKMFVL